MEIPAHYSATVLPSVLDLQWANPTDYPATLSPTFQESQFAQVHMDSLGHSSVTVPPEVSAPQSGNPTDSPVSAADPSVPQVTMAIADDSLATRTPAVAVQTSANPKDSQVASVNYRVLWEDSMVSRVYCLEAPPPAAAHRA